MSDKITLKELEEEFKKERLEDSSDDDEVIITSF
jgi:hypothetical protein